METETKVTQAEIDECIAELENSITRLGVSLDQPINVILAQWHKAIDAKQSK